MEKKKIFMLVASILILMVGLPLAACAKPAPALAPAPKPTPIVLKIVMPQLSGDPTLMAVQPLIDRIKAKSNGELVFQIVGGPEAIPVAQQFDAVRTGVVDAGIGFGLEQPLIFGANLGFIEQNKPWEERKSGWFDYKVAKYSQHGVKLVGKTIHTVWSQLYVGARGVVERPQELPKLGLKIRATASFKPLLTRLGVIPVSIAASEIYPAMQTHVIDGFTYSGIGIVDNGWHEVTPYILEPKMYNSSQQLWINLNKWNSLPKRLQDIVDDSIQWLEQDYDDDFAKLLESERNKMLERGMKLIAFSPADTEWFLKLSQDAAWEDQLAQIKPPGDAEKIRNWLTKK